MRFMLDENVAESVRRGLVDLRYEALFIRDLIPEGSVDPLVAFVAEDKSAVLVSHDGDFQKISPRIPDGQKTRFRKLSRIHLHCNEYQAASRIRSAISLIEHEFELLNNAHDKRMIIEIGKSHIRTNR